MQTLLLIFNNLSIFLEDFLKFSSAIFYNLPVCPFEFVFLFLYLSSSFVFPHQPLLFPPVLRNIPYSETETTLLFFVTECAAFAHIWKYIRRCAWNTDVAAMTNTMPEMSDLPQCLMFGPKTPGVVPDIVVCLLQSAQAPTQSILKLVDF